MDTHGERITEKELVKLDQGKSNFSGRTLRSVFPSGLPPMPRSVGKPGRCRGCSSRGVCEGLPGSGIVQGRIISHDVALSNFHKSLSKHHSFQQTQEHSSSTPGFFRRSAKKCVIREDGNCHHGQGGLAKVRRKNPEDGCLLFRGWNGSGGDSSSRGFERSNREKTLEAFRSKGEQGPGRTE